jgi:hypothetical protein
MKRPMRDAGKSRDEKNKARINDGIPALNMRKERSVIIMYASRPVACRLETPRKDDSRERRVGGDILKIKNFNRYPVCIGRSIGDNLSYPRFQVTEEKERSEDEKTRDYTKR